jgi:flagellar export protein FliJ
VKFRFRLDGLLRIRHFELRRRIALLAERRRAHDELQARARAETTEGERAETSARAAIDEGASAAQMHGLADLASVWRGLASASGIEAMQAERAVVRERSAMLAARTRVEALERLRERRVARWRSEEQRRAQRDLDELGTRGFRRSGEPK